MPLARYLTQAFAVEPALPNPLLSQNQSDPACPASRSMSALTGSQGPSARSATSRSYPYVPSVARASRLAIDSDAGGGRRQGRTRGAASSSWLLRRYVDGCRSVAGRQTLPGPVLCLVAVLSVAANLAPAAGGWEQVNGG